MAKIQLTHSLCKLALLSKQEKALFTYAVLVSSPEFLQPGSGSQYRYCTPQLLAKKTRQSLATIYRHLNWCQEQLLIEKISATKFKIAGRKTVHDSIVERYGVNWQFMNLGKRASKLTWRKELQSAKLSLYSICEDKLQSSKTFIEFLRFLMLAESLRRQSAKAASRNKPRTDRYGSSKENLSRPEGKLSLKAYGEMIGRKSTASHRAIKALVASGYVEVSIDKVYLKADPFPGAIEALEIAYRGYHFHRVKDGYLGCRCSEYSILQGYKKSRRTR